MSYIDEALKKAQRERDSRYQRFGGIIASGPAAKKTSVRKKLAIGSAIALVVLLPAGLLIAVYVFQRPSPVTTASPSSVISESGEAKSPTAPQVMPNGDARSEGPGVRPGALPNQREAENQFREALTAQRRGDHKQAESLYQQALLLDPGHVRALNNLGVLFMDQKKKREAVALFNRAVGLKKDYVDPYYNLACIYARVDEIDESVKFLKIAMSINREVVNWAMKDADMSNVVASEEFKKIMEGQKR